MGLLRLRVIGVALNERCVHEAGGDADDAPQRDPEDQRAGQDVVAQRQLQRVDVLLEGGGELHGCPFEVCSAVAVEAQSKAAGAPPIPRSGLVGSHASARAARILFYK